MGSGNDINNGSKSDVYPTENQGYCLRWNNHKTNLAGILETIVGQECYFDCILLVDNNVQFKAHQVVLASCSPYFQLILREAPPTEKRVIMLPGVQDFEMNALLEYIYTGEVKIFESQIPRIMKIAKMLEVKGLLDMSDLKSNMQQQPVTSPPLNNLFRPSSNPSGDSKRDQSTYLHPLTHSSPIITTSTKISSAQSSSSPPYSQRPPYMAHFYPQATKGSRDSASAEDAPGDRSHWPPIPLPLSRSAQSMLSSVYDSGDNNPLKRKKLSSISSMLLTRDTPILRNVLAQSNAADSSQSASPLNANPSPPRGSGNGNGSDNIENNDTNNNENSANNFGGSAAANASGGNNGSAYDGFRKRSSDRSYHSSNGSDHSDKVSLLTCVINVDGTNEAFRVCAFTEIQRRRAAVALHRPIVRRRADVGRATTLAARVRHAPARLPPTAHAAAGPVPSAAPRRWSRWSRRVGSETGMEAIQAVHEK